MRVIFDHVSGFGRVTDDDFIYSDPRGIREDDMYLRHLENGWIEWGDYWYNLRSVRIRVEDYIPTKTTKKLSKKIYSQWTFVSEQVLDAIKPLYEEYVRRNKFSREIPVEDFLGFECLLYYHNGGLIGANIMKIYRDSDGRALVSYQFLWDYKEPKLSLGSVSQYFECKLAKTLRCDHVYLLGGYESASIYKSTNRGFEWWTGCEWSQDVEVYNKLCKRDDNIRTEKQA